jgi:hypothetical protein
MAVIHHLLAQATHVVARAVVEHHIRQEPTSSPDPSATVASSSVAPSTTTAIPTPTPSEDIDGGDGGGGGGTSPLLFFVALGFGVVFTNLWYDALLFLSSESPKT